MLQIILMSAEHPMCHGSRNWDLTLVHGLWLLRCHQVGDGVGGTRGPFPWSEPLQCVDLLTDPTLLLVTSNWGAAAAGEPGHRRPLSQPARENKWSRGVRGWECGSCEVLTSWWWDGINVTSPSNGNRQANTSEPLPCPVLFKVFRRSQCKGFIIAFRGWSVTKA